MTIEFRTSGSIFDALAEPSPVWLVCPVNCQPGVLGAGLALEFARRWPHLRSSHWTRCSNGELRPGKVAIVPGFTGFDLPVVLLFPTKDHWKDPSRLEWIEAGLADMENWLRDRGDPVTLAVPGLGSGLGGLRWDDVRPLIEATAEDCGQHRFIVYEPR